MKNIIKLTLSRITVLLMLLAIPLVGSTAQTVEDPDASRAFIAKLAYMVGQWEMANRNLDPATQSYIEQRFFVETRYIFDKLGLEHAWRDAETGEWFGTVLVTYDASKKQVVTKFFSRGSASWSENEVPVSIDAEGNTEVRHDDKDSFGAFETIQTHTRVSDDEYHYENKRKYAGTDWFVVDSFVAKRIPGKK